ncbi:MAG: hypothetical protein LBJ10_09285 [Clostridiales bacterium]|jgi:hypothetical protein|nr:hypothetical protein [Clostridiales bacterium]
MGSGFLFAMLFAGVAFVLTAVAWIAYDAKKNRLFMRRAETEKAELLSIIDDAELMVSELNNFSDYIVERIDQKHSEAEDCIARLSMGLDAANSAGAFGVAAGAFGVVAGAAGHLGAIAGEAGTAGAVAGDAGTAGAAGEAAPAGDAGSRQALGYAAAAMGGAAAPAWPAREGAGARARDGGDAAGGAAAPWAGIAGSAGAGVAAAADGEHADGGEYAYSGEYSDGEPDSGEYADADGEPGGGEGSGGEYAGGAARPARPPIILFPVPEDIERHRTRRRVRRNSSKKLAEVLRCAEDGLGESEIAQRLGIGRGEVSLIIGLKDVYEEC